VAEEDDLATIVFHYSGCKLHPNTGTVTVVQGQSKVSVFRNMAKTQAGSSTAPNSVNNGDTNVLQGILPSTAVGDIQVEEAYGGTVNTRVFTVLRLDVIGDINHDGRVNASRSDYLADMSAAQAQSTPGLFVGCCSNNLTAVELVTQCKLTNGTLTLDIQGAAGAFRLWTNRFPQAGETPFLVSGQPRTWTTSAIPNLPATQVLYLEANNSGTATLRYLASDKLQYSGRTTAQLGACRNRIFEHACAMAPGTAGTTHRDGSGSHGRPQPIH